MADSALRNVKSSSKNRNERLGILYEGQNPLRDQGATNQTTSTTNISIPHSRLDVLDEHTCAVKDCHRVFKYGNQLQQHVKITGHKAFRCQCGKGYTKLCSLTRHIKEKVEKPQYQCPLLIPRLCDRFDLRRISHLKNHLLKFHEKTPEEVVAILRPLRKDKRAAKSTEASTRTTVTTDRPAGQIAAPSDSPVLSQPTGVSLADRTGFSAFQPGAAISNLALHTGPPTVCCLSPQGTNQPLLTISSATGPTTEVPSSSAGPCYVNPAGWQSASAFSDLTIASDYLDVPAGGHTANQLDFSYCDVTLPAAGPSAYLTEPFGNIATDMTIQPNVLHGYGGISPGSLSAQQVDFGGRTTGVYQGNQLQQHVAPGAAFQGFPPAQAGSPPQYRQLNYGAMRTQQVPFFSMAPHSVSAGPAEYSTFINDDFGMSMVEYPNTVAGRFVQYLGGEDNVGEFGNFDTSGFSNTGSF